jgi:hypothetical protein
MQIPASCRRDAPAVHAIELPALPALSKPYAPSSARGLPPGATHPELAKRLALLAVNFSPAVRMELLLAPSAVGGVSPMYAVRKDCVADAWLRSVLARAAVAGELLPRGL